MRVRFAPILAMIGLGAGIVPSACNVFINADRCQTNADCPSGFVCDGDGRFCLDSRSDASDAAPDVPDAGDATVDAPACNPNLDFEAPVLVKGLQGRLIYSARSNPTIPNENAFYVSAVNTTCDAGLGNCVDLMVATRTAPGQPYDVKGVVSDVNAPVLADYWPTLSADGRFLFFESARPPSDGGPARSRIYSASKGNEFEDFKPPMVQQAFNVDSVGGEVSPYLHPSGSAIYFGSYARGMVGGVNADLFAADISSGTVLTPAPLVELNTAVQEMAPVVTLGHSKLYFARGPDGARDIFVSARGADGGFQAPKPVSELNTSNDDVPAWVSDDECRIYFVSDRNETPAEFRLWVAERPKTPK